LRRRGESAKADEVYLEARALRLQPRPPSAGPDMISPERVGRLQRSLALEFEQEPVQLPRAEAELLEAVKTFEQIVREKPRSVEALHFLADTHRRLAHVLNASGQRDRALAEYDDAIRLHEQHLASVPDSTYGEGERAEAYFEYARLLSQ